MRKSRIVLLFVILITHILASSFILAKTNEETVKDKPKLIIGDDINYPPYSYVGSNGRATGFNVEIAKAVGESMGYDVEIRLDEWSKTRQALENGEIDAIAGMFYSAEREAYYSFSLKHSITNGDIFTRNDTKINTIKDLKGKTIVVQKADIVAEYLSKTDLNIQLVEVPTVDEALELVANGTYEYAGVLKLPGLYSIKNNKLENIRACNLMLTPNDYCMAVKMGNEDLLLTLNGGLQVIKATGEYQAIYDKWLGIYEKKDLFTFLMNYKWFIIVSLVILVGLIGISITLKHMVDIKTRELREANNILQDYNHEISKKNEMLMTSEEELIAQLEEINSQRDYISFLASHDSLTNLPNRRRFNQELESILREQAVGAVILMDLDNFKSINDTMGHTFGDKVLVNVSRRLETMISRDLFISRFGGDEFIMLLKEKDKQYIDVTLKKLCALFDERLIIDENEMIVTISMGISLFPEDSTKVNQLIMNADMALYSVKNSGKNGYRFFDIGMINKLERRSYIESIIREAIDNDGFKMVYQPQVHLLTGDTHAYEALIRLKNYSISPAEFIPIAEENGMILKIGRIVTHKVIEQISKWQSKGLPNLPVSINFSATQLHDNDYLDFIKKELGNYHVNPRLIEIEITENVFLENKEQTLTFLLKLKQFGIKISIDDFGTGYSSLSYLTFLPVNKVKIDRILSQRFLESNNLKVMDSMISLFHSLNLVVVAEGIEKYEQFLRLRDNRCDYIQGYYFSKPLEAEEIEKTPSINYYEVN